MNEIKNNPQSVSLRNYDTTVTRDEQESRLAALEEWYSSRSAVTQDDLDAAWRYYDQTMQEKLAWSTSRRHAEIFCTLPYEGIFGELITEKENDLRAFESDEVYSRAISYRMAA